MIVALAGLCMGSGAWTLKALRKFQVEHWLFIAMLTGLVLIPWVVTLGVFPNALAAYRDVGWPTLIRANIFAFGWGIANVLCALCFVRIGVALTGGILGGLGLALGVTVPMVFKASGLFEDAADLASPAGVTVLVGVAVMVVGVILVSLAGFGRDRMLKGTQKTSGGFLVGLVMVVIAGVLSTGPNFVFAYSQDPIVSRVCMIKPGDEISVRIAGSSTSARQLSAEWPVSQNGEIRLSPAGLTVKLGGLTVEQAARAVEAELRAKRVLAEPKVRIRAAGGAEVVTPKDLLRLKVIEAAPGRSYRVAPDGRVAIAPIGEVKLGDLSVFAARSLIADEVKAKGGLVEPSVAVDTHNLLAPFAVWTVGMAAGALVNLLYPVYQMRKKNTWQLLAGNWKEIPVAAIGGLQFFVAIVLLGTGSLKLGALGASVGWGIYQATQIVGGQIVGFWSGEWREVHGKPRNQMYAAIVTLIIGAIIVAYGNTQPKI